jgi:hypothetical protein
VVTLTISASDGNWTAYAQTDTSGDNAGLASMAFDVIGTSGAAVTSSYLDVPDSATAPKGTVDAGTGFIQFVSNGQGSTNTLPGNGIGLTAGSQDGFTWTASPVDIAHGTYSGSTGTLTVQADYSVGQGFQTLNVVSNGQWSGPANISFDLVISGSVSVGGA